MTSIMSTQVPRVYPKCAIPFDPSLSYIVFLPPSRLNRVILPDPGYSKATDFTCSDGMTENAPDLSTFDPSLSACSLPSVQSLLSTPSPRSPFVPPSSMNPHTQSTDGCDHCSSTVNALNADTRNIQPVHLTSSLTSNVVAASHSVNSGLASPDLTLSRVYHFSPDNSDEVQNTTTANSRVLLLLHGDAADGTERSSALERFLNLVSSRSAITHVLPEFVAPPPDDDPRLSARVLRLYLMPSIREYRRHRKAPTCSEKSSDRPAHQRHARSASGSFADSAFSQDAAESRTVTELASPSHPPSLSLLDFDQIPSYADFSTNDLCPEQKNVMSITASLSKVRHYLYVAGIDAIRNLDCLKAARITHILNVAGGTVANYFEQSEGMTYLNFSLRDGDAGELRLLLEDLAGFIDGARHQDGIVALHCHMGISRACTVAAAYLMMREGMTAKAALSEIQRCRPVAEPDEAFVGELDRLQARIRNGLEHDTLYRVQTHLLHRQSRFYVAAPVAANHPSTLDNDYAWIIERKLRRGVDVLCGANVSDFVWERAKEIAIRKHTELERYEKMFPTESMTRTRDDDGLCPPAAGLRIWGRNQWSPDTISKLFGPPAFRQGG